MGLSRRFLNLIVNEHRPTIADRHWPGVTSLRTIDLGRHELFYPPGSLPLAALKVEPLTLPTPTFSFRGSRQGCLPVADREVLCMDRYKHAFLFDAATQHVVTIPTRRSFNAMPVSVFVPSARASDDDGDPDGALFVMETWPEHEARCPEPSEQFEALVYRRSSTSSPAKSWHSQLLPPLPYLRNPKYWKFNVGITSYAVVGGGSHICVSLEPSALTQSEPRRHAWK